MSAAAGRRWLGLIGVAIVLGLLAFAIFGPLANLFLWAFAEKWYFPNKIPQEFGFSFWGRVFSPRGGALASLGTSVWIAVLTVAVSLLVAIPAGYAPFGIQNIGDTIFVTYAKQDADAEDEIAGDGFGFVDAYGLDGSFLGRVASGDALNAPWGLAQAPADFGEFSGQLLVGNFGDGRINAFRWGSWEPIGHLKLDDHRPLTIDGLWAIAFGGNNANSGPANTLFFTAGPDDETHGAFGTITVN